MLSRNLRPGIEEALLDTPVVFLTGPRQVGKTTLVRQLTPHYFNLEEPAVLAAARADPVAFVQGLPDRVGLDEVQRLGDLLSAVKLAVDERRVPGRFLLTGSANVLTLPRVSESLAGRVEVLTLWPLSQGELNGRRDSLVDTLFEGEDLKASPTGEAADPWERILAGGFPEPVLTRRARRRAAWFEAYLTTLLQRDVRDLANIEGLVDLPRLMRLLAARACQPLNLADLSRNSGIAPSTLKRYLSLLQTVYLIALLPAWSANLGKRLAHAPRILLPDSGLLGHLVGAEPGRIAREPTLGGPLLENFVGGELTRQLGWSRTRASLHYFRAHSGEEVDFLLEAPDGRLCALEVKSTRSPGPSDWKGLKFLSQRMGPRLVRGVLLYLGSRVIPAGPGLHALPLHFLWA